MAFASYLEYLDMLTDVFAECVRVLEPGGRIAVNVATLGAARIGVSRPTSSPFFKIASDCCCGRGGGARVLERAGRVRGGRFVSHQSGAARPHRTSGHRAEGRFQRAVSRSVRKAMACRMSRRSAPKIS